MRTGSSLPNIVSIHFFSPEVKPPFRFPSEKDKICHTRRCENILRSAVILLAFSFSVCYNEFTKRKRRSEKARKERTILNTPFFCRHCGKQLFEEGKFCPYCGAPIESEQPSPAEPVPPEPAGPAFPEASATPEQAETPEDAVSSPAPADPGDVTPPSPMPPFAEDTAQAVPTPPDAQPAEQSAPRPRAERKKVGALRVVGASFLCLLAVLFAVSSCMIFVLRSATSPKALKGILEDVRLSDLTIPTGDGDPQPLSEYIAEQVPEKYRSDPRYNLNANNIEKLMNRAFIRDFLEDRLQVVAENVYSGSDERFLTSRELKSFLRKNAAEVEKITGYTLSEKDIDEIGSYLEKNEAVENITVNELSMSRLQEEIPFLAAIPFLTSYVTAGLLAGLAVAMLVLAALICRFRGFSLVYVSITCLFTGSVYLTLSLLTNTLANVLYDLYPLQKDFYTRLLSSVRSACLRISLPLIAAGLLCIAALVIIKVVRNAKARKNAPVTEPANS